MCPLEWDLSAPLATPRGGRQAGGQGFSGAGVLEACLCRRARSIRLPLGLFPPPKGLLQRTAGVQGLLSQWSGPSSGSSAVPGSESLPAGTGERCEMTHNVWDQVNITFRFLRGPGPEDCRPLSLLEDRVPLCWQPPSPTAHACERFEQAPFSWAS